jgi:hypothetical protein
MNKQEALQLFENGTVIRYKSTIHTDLYATTLHMPGDFYPRQRLWHIIHGDEAPVCKACSNAVKWDATQPTSKQQYRIFCSVKCSRTDSDVAAKKLNTETCRYGKGRPSIVQKIISTNTEKYGASHAIKLDVYKQKQKNTNIETYGVENVSQSEEVLKKRESTYYAINKSRAHAQSHFSDDILSKINNYGWMYEQHIENKKSITEISKDINVNYEVITRSLKHFNIPITYYPSSSLCETQVYNFVQSITDDNIVLSDKSVISPKHLDIYIPAKLIAIEVNGVYWHCEANGKDAKYHINKTNMCNAKNVRLIHLFESEWYNKQPIVESMIRNVLGGISNKIHARKCDVIEVDSATAADFLNNNHIQGQVRGKVNIGLSYNNQLVCLMVMSKSRYSAHEYEMYRFCSLLNHNVMGGASKLFNYFIRTYSPKTIVSYCDKRWGTGGVYTKLGFVHSHDSAPNYWYVKNGESVLQSRLKFQKHKLSKLLPIFNPLLTELDNMKANKFNRIWDCGNKVFVWTAESL